MSNYDALTTQQFLKSSIVKMYGWMAAGLSITGIVSFIMYQSGWFMMALTRMPALAIFLMVAQVALVIAFTFGSRKMSATGMKVLYILYAMTLGVTMTSVAYTYDLGTIGLAFLITAVYFICLIALGMTTNIDLTKIGTIAYIGLIALIISQIIMVFFNVGLSLRLTSIFGLVIFTGITAYDVQRANVILAGMEDDNPDQEKMIIYMALQMYLDFVNIFLYIVRLLGSRDN